MDATQRFTHRVEDYVRFRPGYPPELLACLREEHGVDACWPVADLGAGTGISTAMFLDAGFTVHAVEPNAAMRAAAQQGLGHQPQFHAVDGTAAATSLPDQSVGLISVAQAFHWFDPVAIVPEWRRILRPGGLVAIYWNFRRVTGSAFLEAYDHLLQRFAAEDSQVNGPFRRDEPMHAFFGSGLRGIHRLRNVQKLDFNGLCGRTLSSSCTPPPTDPRFEPLMKGLEELFAATAENGLVSLEYDTRLIVGTLDAGASTD